MIEVFRREGRSFLMPPAGVPLKPETVIDISRESLIRNWDRLQEWVDEESQSARIYRRLAEDAVLHREGQERFAHGSGIANRHRLAARATTQCRLGQTLSS